MSLLAMVVSGIHLHIMQAYALDEARDGAISCARRTSAYHASTCTQHQEGTNESGVHLQLFTIPKHLCFSRNVHPIVKI